MQLSRLEAHKNLNFSVQTSLFPSPRDLMVMEEKNAVKNANVHTIQ